MRALGNLGMKGPMSVISVAAAFAIRPRHQVHPTRYVHMCSATLEGTVVPGKELQITKAENGAKPRNAGHIEIVIGPMFAGKTSELLRRSASYEARGLVVAMVKSDKDGRYSSDHVVTHDGARKPCFSVPSLAEFRKIAADSYESFHVIAIDEAQFFPDLSEFCAVAADLDGKRVILAGLDGDFKRQKFGQVLDVIPHADSVTKLTAVCRYCENEGNYNSPALFSLRLAEERAQEVVGGADMYAPVCRRHYVHLSQNTVE
jgi:thymidine kinase